MAEIVDRHDKVDAAQAVRKEVQRFLGFAQNGDIDQLKTFVEDYVHEHHEPGAPITPQDVLLSIKDGNGRTALHFACTAGKADAVEWMLQDGRAPAIVDVADEKGLTALALSLITGHSSIAGRLLESGADPNKADTEGVTPLHRAAGHGDFQSVKLLAKHGADLEVQSGAGAPLHWAAGEGHEGVVKELLALGANRDAHNKQGITPIIMAAAGGHGATVALLASAGADVGLVMSGGLTVLHICADLGSAAAVDALLATDVGRKCAALRNDAGMRPIDLAAMGRHRALVEKLHPVTTSNSGGGGSGETVEELMAAGLQRHREHVEAAEAQEREAARAEAAALKPTRFPEASTEAKRAAEATKTEGNAAFAAAPPRLAEALAAYTRAVELDANNHVYWSNRSAVHMALGDAAAALADAEVARRLKPDWPKACYRMAIAREALGMWEEAAVSAWEGVQLDNTNAELKKVLQRCVEEGRKAHQAQQLQSPPQQQPPQQQQR